MNLLKKFLMIFYIYNVNIMLSSIHYMYYHINNPYALLKKRYLSIQITFTEFIPYNFWFYIYSTMISSITGKKIFCSLQDYSNFLKIFIFNFKKFPFFYYPLS